MRWMLIVMVLGAPLAAQTRIDLQSQAKRVDFTSATSTKPFRSGTTLPTGCAQGEMFFKTDGPAGANVYGCASPNTWSLQGNPPLSCADNGTNSEYACAIMPPITAYVSGTSYSFQANTTNTGSATISFNGLGAKPIVKRTNQMLAAGDIRAGQWVTVTYDGMNMQMQSPAGVVGDGPGPGGSEGQLQVNRGGVFVGVSKTGTGSVASTAGAIAAEHCAKFDGNGNLTDAGGPCTVSHVPVTVSAAGPVMVANAGFYFNDSGGAVIYNLPEITSGAIGSRYCFRNATGRAGAIILQAPALTYIDKDGSNSRAGGTLTSGAAAGDAACVVAVDVNQYVAFTGSGTWIKN